jgi:hypothetical protein
MAISPPTWPLPSVCRCSRNRFCRGHVALRCGEVQHTRWREDAWGTLAWIHRRCRSHRGTSRSWRPCCPRLRPPRLCLLRSPLHLLPWLTGLWFPLPLPPRLPGTYRLMCSSGRWGGGWWRGACSAAVEGWTHHPKEEMTVCKATQPTKQTCVVFRLTQ